MASKRKNSVLASSDLPSCRITRARACANHVKVGIAPLVKAEQKPASKGKLKRAALDENNNPAPLTSAPHLKKRAALKDVTNICCADNSQKPSVAISKGKPKESQKFRPASCITKQFLKKAPKLASAVPVENLVINNFKSDGVQVVGLAAVESKNAETVQEVELLGQRESTVLLDVERSLSFQNIERNRDSDCHIAFFEERNSGVQSELTDLKTGKCVGLSIVDIDSDHTNPQMCSPYALEIYRNLRAAELMRRPCSNFLETVQRDITKTMRGILIDWLVEVSEEYKLVPDTLYLTVCLIDRFLAQNYIERQRLQLLGITCMLIASKYEEICAPRVEEFCFITNNTYTKAEVLKMECQVLGNLGFLLSIPTIKTFLRRFLRAAQICRKAPSLTLGYLANYLAELTLVDHSFLRFLPSLLAASAVFLARWTLDQSNLPWNQTLEHYTSYKSSDLKVAVLALQELQHNSTNFPLNAIREKYRQQKFESVSTMACPEVIQSLFC